MVWTVNWTVCLCKHETHQGFVCLQALQILLQCTSEEHFPWHEPPQDREGHVAEADRTLWGRMLQLAHTRLIPALVEHLQDPFPGAMNSSVRVLAFYASWVRFHFCKEQRLLMSRPILDALAVRPRQSLDS